MIRRLLRRGLRVGAIVGAIAFLVQIFLRNPAPKRSDSQPQLTPKPAATKAEPATKTATKAAKSTAKAAKAKSATKTAKTAKTTKPWADPVKGACPAGYPVKVKLASGIFHVPGGLAYDRTTPDRCYVDAAAAEKDGFRQAKR